MKLTYSLLAGVITTAAVLSATSNMVTVSSVGAYSLNMGGKTYSSLCLQPESNSKSTQSFSATVTSLSDFLSNPKEVSVSDEYKQQAYLCSQLTKTGLSSTDRNSIQEAASSLANHAIPADAGAASFLSQAQQCYKTVQPADFQLASWTDSNGQCHQAIVTPPTTASATPEPSSMLLIGGGLMVAVGAFARRKKAGAKAAETEVKA